MIFYSTNKKAPDADLQKAVVKGLAEDKGLYMPEVIKALPKDFFDNIQDMSFQEISYNVADAFLPKGKLGEITLQLKSAGINAVKT
mgnify:CR=1 FL=1